ncbi:hypothetical protein D3C86_2232100 [compost metagenome]
MAGNEMARILDLKTPFHEGFEEIAYLAEHRKNESEPKQQQADPAVIGKRHRAAADQCGHRSADCA